MTHDLIDFAANELSIDMIEAAPWPDARRSSACPKYEDQLFKDALAAITDAVATHPWFTTQSLPTTDR